MLLIDVMGVQLSREEGGGEREGYDHVRLGGRRVFHSRSFPCTFFLDRPLKVGQIGQNWFARLWAPHPGMPCDSLENRHVSLSALVRVRAEMEEGPITAPSAESPSTPFSNALFIVFYTGGVRMLALLSEGHSDRKVFDVYISISWEGVGRVEGRQGGDPLGVGV